MVVVLLAINEMIGGGYDEFVEREYKDLAVGILWTPFFLLGLALLVCLFIVCDNCGYRCFAIIIKMTVGAAVYMEHARSEPFMQSMRRFLAIDIHRKKRFLCVHCHTEYSIAD